MTPEFRLFDVLSGHGVPYVVVGGHAVNFHGIIRATEGSDVLWIRSPTAEAGLLEAWWNSPRNTSATRSTR